MRMKTDGASSVSWKSEEQGRVSQGSLIWSLIIWTRAVTCDYMTLILLKNQIKNYFEPNQE